MKKVEINELQFKRLIDSVKNCVAKDDFRPQLQYIQIKVGIDTITAYSLDGYKASRVEIKNTCSVDEEFVCYIKPFTVKTSKRGTNLVVIEQLNEQTFVEVPTEYGTLRYAFTAPQDDYIDVEKIFNANRQHEQEFMVNSRYLIDVLKNFDYANKNVVFEIKKDNTKPFIISAKNDEIINEQLVLPTLIRKGI